MEILKEIDELSKKYLYKGKDKLIELESIGIQIIPSNFYSPVPSVKDIEEGWERKVSLPFYDKDVYNNDEMLELLNQKLMPYVKEFCPPDNDDESNPKGYFWKNSQYSHSDAMSLYCMIRYFKPEKVIEIGGGFSTLIIDQALKENGKGEIIEIEPYPRPFLKDIKLISQNITKPVQDIPCEIFDQLKKDDILFIDSTHSVKESSDCTYIYLKILNKLKKCVIIHIHDIFLPQPIPKEWHYNFSIHWTEQYILQALINNPHNYKVIFGSNYHRVFNKKDLDKFMANKEESGGGSFWIVKK